MYITAGALALVFMLAYRNSRAEDTRESERIKSEVQRLVRLRQEFEEQASDEDVSDDSMAAALKAAQAKLSEASGDGGDDGAAAEDGAPANDGGAEDIAGATGAEHSAEGADDEVDDPDAADEGGPRE